MKLATWNVNSLKVRLPQVLEWLGTSGVDVLCLQELKMPHDKFPLAEFEAIGYQACWAGQKTYNGVAVISRDPAQAVQINMPGFPDDHQRLIAATLPSPQGDIRVVSVYCPNGQAVGSEKYSYKLAWFAALREWLEKELTDHPRIVVLGDYNVAPADADVYDPAKWEGDVLVSPLEREAFEALLNLGFTDAFRHFPQKENVFSWWDYRRMAFRRNAGLRIDHALVSSALLPFCTACEIDKAPRRNEQPSDHTPVIVTLDFTATEGA